MDEAVLAMLGTLVEIRQELGEGIYESAVERARIAIAAEVLVEAERRALRARREAPAHTVDGNVVTLRPRPADGHPSATPPSAGDDCGLRP